MTAPRRRSGVAIAAQHRRAGAMKDRRAPRGGQRNEQADLLEERCPDCNGTGSAGGHACSSLECCGPCPTCDGTGH